MKIGFVVGTLDRGGAEKQLVFMLRALQAFGANAEVFSLTRGEYYEAEIRNAGVAVKYVGGSQNRMSRLWTIMRAVRESGADILQSSHFYTNIYAGITGKLLGLPSIGAIRSDLTYEITGHRITGSLQVSLPDLLVTNSEKARQRLLERRVNPRKIEFVRNVVEVESGESVDRSRQGLSVLFAGRLDENKRPERFVRLASMLSEQCPDLRLKFKVAGNGEKLKELEVAARRFGLGPDRLVFLGACDRMSDVYRDADILVSTSDREGTPNVVLEAMAHGLPVVATAVGGTVEILDHTRGILVEPNNEDALRNATWRLVSDRKLRYRLGNAGKKYVAENHSLDRLQKHLLGVYGRLLSVDKRKALRRARPHQEVSHEL